MDDWDDVQDIDGAATDSADRFLDAADVLGWLGDNLPQAVSDGARTQSGSLLLHIELIRTYLTQTATRVSQGEAADEALEQVVAENGGA